VEVIVDMPVRDDVVIPRLLERNAELRPDGVMATFEDGTVWTWSDSLRIARRAANALHTDGVRQGDHVAVFLPNGPDFLAAWFGITALGAAIVPINLAFKGVMLEHLVATTRPRRVVSAGALAETFTEVAADVPILEPGRLAAGAEAPAPLDRPIEFWDTHHIMLTGGTTGPSKAARCSHLHFHNLGLYGTRDRGLGEDDVFLIDLPLFHSAALGMVGGCFTTMTPINVRSGPNLREYWKTIKETNATIAVVLSSMIGFLMSQTPSPADTDHRLRFLISIPITAEPQGFMTRFGIPELVAAYGGTEVSTAMSSPLGVPIVPQTCGVLRPGYHARIADEHDIPVAPGRTGELLLRHDLPWALCTEYVGDPEATARAWRNGWFHTGDLLRQAEDGNYYFVDRAKDAIRRRGENVSCFEVERHIVGFPGVGEVACVAAPSSMGVDDELKAWVVPTKGQQVDFEKLVRHLIDVLPHFMVPRYFELTDVLPKNPSMKVQKFLLRERGDSSGTWDAEVDGRIRITSRGLVELGPVEGEAAVVATP
jgi:crotonobetaine/carnitine-CoA ligase